MRLRLEARYLEPTSDLAAGTTEPRIEGGVLLLIFSPDVTRQVFQQALRIG
jgi:hypothetical protein